MRVLYVSHGYTPHDHRFLRAMRAGRVEVLFVSRLGRSGSETRPIPDGVRRLMPFAGRARAGLRLGLGFAAYLRRLLRENPVDLIHAGPVQDCAWPAALAGQAPLVSMSWGSDLLERARFGVGRWLAASALRRSSAFLGDCLAVRERALRLGARPDRIMIFPWGVDLTAFRPAAESSVRRQLGWEGMTVAVCVRSWEPMYGIETVLRAFRLAARCRPSLRLILAGGGRLRPRILRQVVKWGLADRVWLPGYVEYADLPEIYHAADVYLAASRSDGSSVSLLEAMACGLPSLVTDIAGNREWVEPGVSGSLFPVGDALVLADLLNRSVEGKPALVDQGRRARAVAEQRANWEVHAPKLLEAYAWAAGSA